MFWVLAGIAVLVGACFGGYVRGGKAYLLAATIPPALLTMFALPFTGITHSISGLLVFATLSVPIMGLSGLLGCLLCRWTISVCKPKKPVYRLW